MSKIAAPGYDEMIPDLVVGSRQRRKPGRIRRVIDWIALRLGYAPLLPQMSSAGVSGPIRGTDYRAGLIVYRQSGKAVLGIDRVEMSWLSSDPPESGGLITMTTVFCVGESAFVAREEESNT